MTAPSPADRRSRRRPPWTVIVATIVPPLYLFPIAAFFMAQGPTPDLGDLSGIGRFVGVLGVIELILSCGVWAGAKWMWKTTIALRVLTVVALAGGQIFELPLVFMTAACWIVPAVISLVLLILEPSRKWCGLD